MEKQGCDFDHVKRAFNELKVLRGQYTSIATSDGEGNPNVAPIGSMRIVDAETVHVLQGFLPKTLSNLRKNPKAAFSTCVRQSLLGRFSTPKAEQEVLGYQVHCTFTGESDARADIRAEVETLMSRVPFVMRRPFRRFCDANLNRLLMFRVTDIRIIGAPQ